MERKDIIKIIPEPKNEDVIVYDLTLKSLLDVNVIEEYKKILADYKIKRENYILMEQELEQHKISINNIYLYNKKWSEKDYIEMLQKDKKTYSTYFNDIKKIENNIQILEKKYKILNEQIEIQRNKELKEVETKRKNINNEIEETKKNITKLNTQKSSLKLEYDRYLKQIEELQEDIDLCLAMQQELDNKEYQCQYCGTIITNGNSKKRIFNMLDKKINKNTKLLNSYKTSLEKTEKDLSYITKELKENKSILENDMEFKKQDYNFYIKKSVKILEMEATRDEIQKDILKYKDEYENNKIVKSEEYKTLKDRIDKYELSLQNLQKIKESKQTFAEEYKIINNLKPILLKQNEKLKFYKKFIEIYFKIYEQKANDYFGNNIKFKLFRFNSLDLEEIFEIYYNGIEYTQLHPKQREELDKICYEKISYLY